MSTHVQNRLIGFLRSRVVFIVALPRLPNSGFRKMVDGEEDEVSGRHAALPGSQQYSSLVVGVRAQQHDCTSHGSYT